ncbi:hypothetical protein SCHIN_v1c00710 [Spiroplasma chinense]|uniref:Uncharacterized protein n=1 Tax=Spiroplasma chinense TaxID=216932 RepID=A0A5B9Y3L7_9MOLU|nr:hypothetical protein [Spiroplasma chinense]QEH61269.1 hypothetical protein SCHIN_v1c00710 [Spiroplasma chinense]
MEEYDLYIFSVSFANGKIIPRIKILIPRSDPKLSEEYDKIYLQNTKGKKGLDLMNRDMKNVLSQEKQYFLDLDYAESPLVMELRRQIKELTDGWAADREAWKIEKAELLEIISLQNQKIEMQQVLIDELKDEVVDLKAKIVGLETELKWYKDKYD